MEFRENYVFKSLLYILIISQYIRLARAHSSGAPSSKCQSMVPGHFAPKQDIPCPFQTSVDKVNVTGGQALKIVLRSPNKDVPLKGFLVMVRKPGIDDRNYGHFLDQSDPKKAQGLQCFGRTNSAMTHRSGAVKSVVNLIWIAPKTVNDEEYNVVVTFVQGFWTVWDNQVYPERIFVAKSTGGDSEENGFREENPADSNSNGPQTTAPNEGFPLFTNIINNFLAWLRS